jgi:hypothetical protein
MRRILYARNVSQSSCLNDLILEISPKESVSTIRFVLSRVWTSIFGHPGIHFLELTLWSLNLIEQLNILTSKLIVFKSKNNKFNTVNVWKHYPFFSVVRMEVNEWEGGEIGCWETVPHVQPGKLEICSKYDFNHLSSLSSSRNSVVGIPISTEILEGSVQFPFQLLDCWFFRINWTVPYHT